jgi:hypothetical protein
MTADLVSKLNADRNEWLDDVIAGLLINGVPSTDICIEHHLMSRIVVTVRGVPKYEWRIRDRVLDLPAWFGA